MVFCYEKSYSHFNRSPKSLSLISQCRRQSHSASITGLRFNLNRSAKMLQSFANSEQTKPTGIFIALAGFGGFKAYTIIGNYNFNIPSNPIVNGEIQSTDILSKGLKEAWSRLNVTRTFLDSSASRRFRTIMALD